MAEKLSRYRAVGDILILALPRGGVPVAFEVAKSLGAPLDVFITKKLRFPYNPELAFLNEGLWIEKRAQGKRGRNALSIVKSAN